MGDEAGAAGDIRGHGGFEVAVANKGHNGVDGVGRQLQRHLQRLDVLEVLPKRVLKFEGLLVYLLRPLGLIFTTENPPRHILGLKHENPEWRNNHMVDLGGAVQGGQGDVVNFMVDLLVQQKPGKEANLQFAEPSFAQG